MTWPIWALSSRELRQQETSEPVTVRPRSAKKAGEAVQQRAASPAEDPS